MASATIQRSSDQELQSRLYQLHELTGDVTLLRLAQQLPPFAGANMASAEERRDWVDTCLMNAFRNGRDSEVFALLFERNRGEFLSWIKRHIRHQPRLDANDVLQQVFLNICRYPDRFVADRAGAFRIWGQRIVRNTVIGLVEATRRQPRSLLHDDDLVEDPVDRHNPSPDVAALQHEAAAVVDHAYLLFLGLYLRHFEQLSAREQRALTMVEVEQRSYREVAEQLGMSLANVKMMIFRARRRITNGATLSLQLLGADMA